MKKFSAFLLAGTFLASVPAVAQQATRVIILNGSTVVTTANPLPVNVVSGGFSGTTSNASSGVATTATNAPTVAYNYVFNGTTWDQLSSITVGTKHAPTVAIVDASGNQITSFGSTITSPVGAGTSAAAVRTTTASDSPEIAILNTINTNVQAGASATGAAVPSSAIYMGVNVGGNLTGFAPGVAGTPSTQFISVQGGASMTKLLVTPDSVALPANQSVNVAQMNGVTTTMGNGVAGTGVQRVAIASDNTAFLVNGAQGSAALSATNGGFQNILQGNAVLSVSNPIFSTPIPSAASGAALTAVTCGSAASSCVLKASAGSFYGVYAECTAACWLMVFNATSAPSNGATTAGVASGNLVECVDIAAASSKSLNYPTFPRAFSVGITAVISSTACATLTLSTVGFVSGSVM